MTTGERIREARKKANMTQAELAQKLNIPYQSIGQWERDIRNPKHATIQRLALALDCDFLWLLWGDAPEQISYDIQKLFNTHEPVVEKAAKLAIHYINSSYTARGYTFSEQEAKLIHTFSRLNSSGKQAALEQILALSQDSEYQQNDAAPTPSE